MDMSRLYGMHYARLAADAAASLSAHLGTTLGARDELAITLDVWPAAIQPEPLRALDGRLIAGDPLVLGATDVGILFEGLGEEAVLVPWADVRDLRIVPSRTRQSA
jgi:hypothetical protein